MNNIKIITVVSVLLLVFACSEEQLEVNNEFKSIERKGERAPINEIVIRYKENVDEAEKDSIRSNYGIVNYQRCPCADETLELWVFSESLDASVIEERKSSASDDPDLDGTLYNKEVLIQQVGVASPNLNGSIEQALLKRVDNNSSLTIAVLDTGINYLEDEFDEDFLYNNDNNVACEASPVKDLFGWDFVNGDNDPFDDNNHGTMISQIINSNLKAQNIDHQILPVKVFDANGRGSYFNILCGYAYATSKEEVRIINMSFGSYTYKELFNDFIEESQDDVLVVTSAGNNTEDNDLIPHFPSSYTSENILSVAGLENTNVYTSDGNSSSSSSLAWYSNYGVTSVDVAANGSYNFNINNEDISVEGTSFACAYASYKSAMLYTSGVLPIELKNKVIENAVIFPNQLSTIKYRAALLP